MTFTDVDMIRRRRTHALAVGRCRECGAARITRKAGRYVPHNADCAVNDARWLAALCAVRGNDR